MRTLLLTLAATFLLGGAVHAQSSTGHLDPQTFKAEVDKGKARLIDVRTPEEYAKGHIDGALNIDWNNDDFMGATAKVDKTQPVLLYCAVGGRSDEAMNAMAKAGFTNVHDMSGGFNAWRKQGLPVSMK